MKKLMMVLAVVFISANICALGFAAEGGVATNTEIATPSAKSEKPAKVKKVKAVKKHKKEKAAGTK